MIEFLDLPRSMYDRPLFHHPPLTAALLRPFVALQAPHAAITVAWLGHVLAIVGVAMVCWSWRRRSWRGTEFLLWLPVLAVALDPLLAFCSRKLWPDVLAGGFAGLAVGCLCVGIERRRAPWVVAAGVGLGLAGLAKLTAVLVLVVGMGLIWTAPNLAAAVRRRLTLGFVVPALLLVGSWLVVFHAEYGEFTPSWIRPTPALIAANPHIAREVSRPWHYYLSQSAMIAPVFALVVVASLIQWRRLATPRLGMPIAWMILVWLALMLSESRGHGMQMRYLTPAAPALYVALAALLARTDPRRSPLPLVATLAIAFGAVFSGFYLAEPGTVGFDEIKAVPEIVIDLITGKPPGSG